MKIEVDIELACELIAESWLASCRFQRPKVMPVYSELGDEVIVGFEIMEGAEQ